MSHGQYPILYNPIPITLTTYNDVIYLPITPATYNQSVEDTEQQRQLEEHQLAFVQEHYLKEYPWSDAEKHFGEYDAVVQSIMNTEFPHVRPPNWNIPPYCFKKYDKQPEYIRVSLRLTVPTHIMEYNPTLCEYLVVRVTEHHIMLYKYFLQSAIFTHLPTLLTSFILQNPHIATSIYYISMMYRAIEPIIHKYAVLLYQDNLTAKSGGKNIFGGSGNGYVLGSSSGNSNGSINTTNTNANTAINTKQTKKTTASTTMKKDDTKKTTASTTAKPTTSTRATTSAHKPTTSTTNTTTTNNNNSINNQNQNPYANLFKPMSFAELQYIESIIYSMKSTEREKYKQIAIQKFQVSPGAVLKQYLLRAPPYLLTRLLWAFFNGQKFVEEHAETYRTYQLGVNHKQQKDVTSVYDKLQVLFNLTKSRLTPAMVTAQELTSYMHGVYLAEKTEKNSPYSSAFLPLTCNVTIFKGGAPQLDKLLRQDDLQTNHDILRKLAMESGRNDDDFVDNNNNNNNNDNTTPTTTTTNNNDINMNIYNELCNGNEEEDDDDDSSDDDEDDGYNNSILNNLALSLKNIVYLDSTEHTLAISRALQGGIDDPDDDTGLFDETPCKPRDDKNSYNNNNNTNNTNTNNNTNKGEGIKTKEDDGGALDNGKHAEDLSVIAKNTNVNNKNSNYINIQDNNPHKSSSITTNSNNYNTAEPTDKHHTTTTDSKQEDNTNLTQIEFNQDTPTQNIKDVQTHTDETEPLKDDHIQDDMYYGDTAMGGFDDGFDCIMFYGAVEDDGGTNTNIQHDTINQTHNDPQNTNENTELTHTDKQFDNTQQLETTSQIAKKTKLTSTSWFSKINLNTTQIPTSPQSNLNTADNTSGGGLDTIETPPNTLLEPQNGGQNLDGFDPVLNSALFSEVSSDGLFSDSSVGGTPHKYADRLAGNNNDEDNALLFNSKHKQNNITTSTNNNKGVQNNDKMSESLPLDDIAYEDTPGLFDKRSFSQPIMEEEEEEEVELDFLSETDDSIHPGGDSDSCLNDIKPDNAENDEDSKEKKKTKKATTTRKKSTKEPTQRKRKTAKNTMNDDDDDNNNDDEEPLLSDEHVEVENIKQEELTTTATTTTTTKTRNSRTTSRSAAIKSTDGIIKEPKSRAKRTTTTSKTRGKKNKTEGDEINTVNIISLSDDDDDDDTDDILASLWVGNDDIDGNDGLVTTRLRRSTKGNKTNEQHDFLSFANANNNNTNTNTILSTSNNVTNQKQQHGNNNNNINTDKINIPIITSLDDTINNTSNNNNNNSSNNNNNNNNTSTPSSLLDDNDNNSNKKQNLYPSLVHTILPNLTQIKDKLYFSTHPQQCNIMFEYAFHKLLNDEHVSHVKIYPDLYLNKQRNAINAVIPSLSSNQEEQKEEKEKVNNLKNEEKEQNSNNNNNNIKNNDNSNNNSNNPNNTIISQHLELLCNKIKKYHNNSILSHAEYYNKRESIFKQFKLQRLLTIQKYNELLSFLPSSFTSSSSSSSPSSFMMTMIMLMTMVKKNHQYNADKPNTTTKQEDEEDEEEQKSKEDREEKEQQKQEQQQPKQCDNDDGDDDDVVIVKVNKKQQEQQQQPAINNSNKMTDDDDDVIIVTKNNSTNDTTTSTTPQTTSTNTTTLDPQGFRREPPETHQVYSTTTEHPIDIEMTIFSPPSPKQMIIAPPLVLLFQHAMKRTNQFHQTLYTAPNNEIVTTLPTKGNISMISPYYNLLTVLQHQQQNQQPSSSSPSSPSSTTSGHSLIIIPQLVIKDPNVIPIVCYWAQLLSIAQK